MFVRDARILSFLESNHSGDRHALNAFYHLLEGASNSDHFELVPPDVAIPSMMQTPIRAKEK